MFSLAVSLDPLSALGIDFQSLILKVGVLLGGIIGSVVVVALALTIIYKYVGFVRVFLDNALEDSRNRRIIQDNYDRMYEKKRNGMVTASEYRRWAMQDEAEYERWYDKRESNKKSKRSRS